MVDISLMLKILLYQDAATEDLLDRATTWSEASPVLLIAVPITVGLMGLCMTLSMTLLGLLIGPMVLWFCFFGFVCLFVCFLFFFLE